MKKSKVLFVLALGVTTLASCGGKAKYNTYDIVNNRYIPSTYKGKDVYYAYLGTPLKTLNSAVTMQAENAQHIANFVDGLIENDEFGRLEKALAEKIFVNDAMDEYKFYIRGGTENPMGWYTNDGKPYQALIGGQRVTQYVTGDDFVTAAKYTLDARNLSDCYYLPAMFIKGGYEYWSYTFALYYRDNVSKNYMGSDLTTNSGLANATMAIANAYGRVQLNITAEDIPQIANFSRVGVTSGKETYEDKEYYYVKYELENPATYFTSVLTYTPFLPINEAFIDQVSFRAFGKKAENFLYNGAFFLDSWDETKMVYTKNQNYWDAESVHINRIEYSVVTGTLPDDFIRKEYEKGKVDAFGVSQTDADGWKKYITGPKGTGTIEDPYNSEVYSREIDVVDSTFFKILNVNRTEWSSNHSNLSQAASDNGSVAMKLNDVRKLLLDGVNYATYNKRYGLTDNLRDQYQMWTYVPKGFVENADNAKDYIEYVYEEYADRYDMEIDDVRELLKQGQLPAGYEDNYVSNTKALAEKAVAAVEAVNAAGGVTYSVDGASYTKKITFPVKFEYLGLNWNAKQAAWDAEWIEEFNETVNACTTNKNKVSATLPACENGQYPKFEIVNNTKVTEQNYTDMGESGEYHIYVVGWGADYADPLTYLNTMHSGSGDMSAYGGFDGENKVPDYRVDDSGNVTRLDNLLEDYDEYVDRGARIYDNTDNRFSWFAKAEVELLFNIHVIKPDYMSGQGWSVTISKLAGYETPTAAYGLSSNKLKGVYSLTTAMNGADRKAAKAKFEADKKKELESTDHNIYELDYFGI